jgi:hypothetical protein
MTLRAVPLTSLVALAALAPAGSAQGAPALLDSYVVPGDAVFPEGIAVWRGKNRFFVSSAGDGTIFSGALDKRRMHVFLGAGSDGRMQATGMKVGARGRLYVSGASTSRMYVYSARSGRLLRAFQGRAGGFINDVTLTHGAAFFTDSFNPVLYRVGARAAAHPRKAVTRLRPWLSLRGTPIHFQDGFNLNGIVSAGRGRFLLVVQTNTGRLFRITRATKRIVPVDLGGDTVVGGDGLLLRGRTLFVVQGADNVVTMVHLSRTFRSARSFAAFSDSRFNTPTTLAQARGGLLIVNSQFNDPNPGPPFLVTTTRLRDL